jgi:hypothetical protein
MMAGASPVRILQKMQLSAFSGQQVVSILKLWKNCILNVCGRVAYPKNAKPYPFKMRTSLEFSGSFLMYRDQGKGD